MVKLMQSLFAALLFVSLLSCTSSKNNFDGPEVIYQSEQLIITQVGENTFEHTSFLSTQDFGKVACNGLIVQDNGEVVIFDTPTDDAGAAELIEWIGKHLKAKINAVVPTHFHNDCLGGLHTFTELNIPSYASSKTIQLAKENNSPVPQNHFEDSLTLAVGHQKVTARFFGKGHTTDNVIGYFPNEDILFGGCLIKELNATKGYLGDAQVDAWSATVERIKKAYPNVKTVIPGHGLRGNAKLLDYTIDLFKNDEEDSQ